MDEGEDNGSIVWGISIRTIEVIHHMGGVLLGFSSDLVDDG